jgi:hypothetical protein
VVAVIGVSECVGCDCGSGWVWVVAVIGVSECVG